MTTPTLIVPFDFALRCARSPRVRMLCFCVITAVFCLIQSCINESSICEVYKLHSDSEQCATVGVLRELLNCRGGYDEVTRN